MIHQRLRTWGAAAALAAAAAGFLIWRGSQHVEPWTSLSRGTWPVAAVPDAVHIELQTPGGRRSVRLLGIEPIDAATCRAAVEALCLNAPVRVSFDEHVRLDPDGAAPGYVYLPDGRMVNEVVILDGAACHDADQPHALARWFGRLTTRAE